MNTRRRSSRRIGKSTTPENDDNDAKVTIVSDEGDVRNNSDDESVDKNEGSKYNLNGVSYPTYQEMVDAKRRRNEEYLQQSGLLQAVQVLSSQSIKPKKAGRGLVANKKRKSNAEPLVKRQSRRLLGVAADGKYVENEKAGRLTIGGGNAMTPDNTNSSMSLYDSEPRFYGNRINDGSDVTLEEAVENSESKYQTSISDAETFFRSWAAPNSKETKTKKNVLSDEQLRKEIEMLSVDDQKNVAKVVPERIYSIAVHPSEKDLVVAVGDKSGHVGLWNVDDNKNSDDSAAVYLFRYHTSVVSNLEWNYKKQLVSFSYDGTVRVLDVASEKSTEVFAVYDDSDEFKNKLGYDLDTGHKYWTQYGCLDHRNEDCFFVSTSRGTAMHLDLRCQKSLTFHEELSEKKINTLSLHPNGHSLISAGLDCTVQLWDIRKFDNKKKKKASSPVAMYHGGRSINSAFFSPNTGSNVICTSMNNKLDILQDFHLQSTTNNKYIKPSHSILHNNQTGRWLTTLMARFHPLYDDLFCVGCMKQPRQIEIFSASPGKMVRNISGEALSSVASRTNFHPTLPIVVGGNSSGRVTVVR